MGRRLRSYGGESNDSKKGRQSQENGNGDLESGQLGGRSGSRPRPNMFRFKDAADTAMADRRREDLKKKLLEGVDREQLESFRKSDDEVSLVASFH